MKDGVVLFYCKDGILYPVSLSKEEDSMLQMTAHLFAPLKVILDKPQGKAVNLRGNRE